jgi:hypothetical protein
MCWAPASSTSCTFTGLANGVPSTFAVQAVAQNRKTSAFVASASVVPVSAPSAPQSVSAVEGSGSATVSWRVPSSTGGSRITGYTVSASPFVAAPATCVGVTTTSCVFTGLTNGVSYTFRVVAINAAGNSPSTSAAQAVTPQSATQSSSLHVLFVKTARWARGYQGHFTVLNPTNNVIGAASVPWHFSFTLRPGTTVSNMTGASWTTTSSTNGTTVMVTNAPWNSAISPHKFVVVGITVVGVSAPVLS